MYHGRFRVCIVSNLIIIALALRLRMRIIFFLAGIVIFLLHWKNNI